MGKGKRNRDQAPAPGRPTTIVGPVRRDAFSDVSLAGMLGASGYSTSLLSAYGLPAFMGGVGLICDEVAARKWSEWRGDDELPPSRLVRRPAQAMRRREWTWRVTSALVVWKVAYLLRVGGLDAELAPWSLLPIPNASITPDGPVDVAGILPPTAYRINGRGRVSAEDLCIIRVAPFLGLADWELSLLALARNTLTAAAYADAYGRSWWYEGGAPTVQITTDQELTGPQAIALGDRYVERRQAGAGRPLVLGKGAKAETLGIDPTQASAVDARNQINADVARLLRIPPVLLNVPVAATTLQYANAESLRKDLARTVDPYGDAIAEAMSDELPGDYLTGRTVRLVDVKAWTAGEFSTRMSGWSTAIAADITDAKEVRSLEGLGRRPERPDPEPVAPDPAQADALEADPADPAGDTMAPAAVADAGGAGAAAAAVGLDA